LYFIGKDEHFLLGTEEKIYPPSFVNISEKVISAAV